MSLNWNERFELAKAYYEHYGHLNVVTSFRTNDGITYAEDGFRLGDWLNGQRRQCALKEITREHHDKLRSIGMVFENRHDLEWEKFYTFAQIYLEHYGDLSIPLDFRTNDGFTRDETGKNLGAWLKIQKYKYNCKELSKERYEKLEKLFKQLEQIGEEDRINRELEWENMYVLACAYYQHYNHLSVPRNFITENGYERDENGENLGLWIRTQRQLYQTSKLTEDKIQKLEEIGMTFADVISNEWNRMYNLAKVYYEHYGNLNIPRKFITKNGYEYDANGSKLGKWINLQYCRNHDGHLSKEEFEKLSSIGMLFESQRKKYWQKMYTLAQAYYAHHKNLEVPTNFITKNGYEYDVSGEKLGIWLRAQRQQHLDKKLSKEHIQQLESIGMLFVNLHDYKWERMYNLASIYYSHHGHLNIESDFKTKDGYCYDPDGLALGSWITQQRANYRDKILYVDREQKLITIGMTFGPIKYNSWETMYDLACEYYKHHHHLKINTCFVTKNGYEYDSKGEKLGSWISAQRRAYKQGCLSQMRIKKLQQIGMIFDYRCNQEDNQNICELYFINYLKYKKEIDAIPHNEFVAKINYLVDEGLPFVIDKTLNPIFFMSSINMEVKYGVSLEKLMSEYIKPQEKVKRR